MAENTDLMESVAVTFSVQEWAYIVASIGRSPLDLTVKESLNSRIYDCVMKQERALS